MNEIDIKVKKKLESIININKRIDTQINSIKTGDVSPFFLSLMGTKTTLTYKLSISLSTTFGMSFYEQVCEILANEAGLKIELQHKVLGEVSNEVNQYLSSTLDNDNYKPNRDEELKKIKELAGTGIAKKHQDSIADVFITLQDGTEIYIDITTVKPNKKEFRAMKRKLLTWTAMRLSVNPNAKVEAYMAIPYNPESGTYSRHSKCYDKKDLLVEDELWGLVSNNTYDSKRITKIFESLHDDVTKIVDVRLNEITN